MKPRVSVFLPSYNKHLWVEEALQTVLAQDYLNFEIWVIENSDDEETRQGLKDSGLLNDPRVIYEETDFSPVQRYNQFTCGVLLNRYYPRANGDIIFYLSDDDLIMNSHLFSELVAWFDAHPARDALYFNLYRFRASGPGQGFYGPFYSAILATAPRGAGQVDCMIDGGQVAYRKSVIEKLIEKGHDKFFEEYQDAANSHADGTHMQLVAAETGTLFYPLAVDGVIHRTTPKSTWTPYYP